MTKHMEVVTLKHKEVSVTVSINYDLGEVSLVEQPRRMGYNGNSYLMDSKKWVFAGRGLEYMQGWLDILEAMRLAVKYGQAMLQEKHGEDVSGEKDVKKRMIKILGNEKIARKGSK